MVSKSEENWPEWPKDSKGQRLVDVKVACSADELFLLLWGPKSPYVAKSQEVLGNKDYTETAWCGRLQDLEGGKQGSPPRDVLKAADYEGMFRKTTCSGSGMGLKYVNTELQRCLRAEEGGPFEMEVVVQTTATYGERFRAIIKHRIEANGPDKSTYLVEYVLVYIASTNGLLKKAIERGATNGVTKNFQVLMEVLGTFKELGDGAAQPELSVDPQANPAPGPQEQAGTPHYWWNFVVAAESSRLMQGPTVWLRRKAGMADSAGRGVFAPMLAALAVAFLITVLLLALQSLSMLVGSLPGHFGRTCRVAFGVLDLPSSTAQVFWGAALLLLANRLLGVVLRLLPSPGSSPSTSDTAQTVSDTSRVADHDHPTSGIRYDGYERSLESAEANILEGEGALKRRNRSLGSMAAEAWQNGAVTQKRRDQLKQGFRTGFKSLMDVTKWPAKKEERPGARSSRTEPPSPATSPPPSRGPNGAGSRYLPPSRAGVTAAKSGRSAGSDKAGSVLSAASGALSDDAESRLEGGGESSTGRQVEAHSQREGGKIREYLNILDRSEEAVSSMFGNWSSTTSRSQKATLPTPTAPPAPKDAAAIYQAQEEAVGQESPPAKMVDLERSNTDEGTGPIEEEVFENERYQPFRAWGHTWPGHFLPTDRVGHWSSGDILQDPLLDSASFDAVAPAVKQGWEWKEEGWQIDMRGLLENAVDEEGWAYATDFAWMQWPPKPGQGRFRKVRDYVRRRRWHRTRVFSGIPLQASSPPRLPAARMSKPHAAQSLLTQSLAEATAEPGSAEHGNVSPTDGSEPRQIQPSTDAAGHSRSVSQPAASVCKDEGSAHGPTASQRSFTRVATAEELKGQQNGEGTSRDSSFDSRSEGKGLTGWREKLSRSRGGSRDLGEALGKKGPEGEGAGKRFAGRMNQVLSAATHGLRPGSAKKERDASVRPVLARESTPQASSESVAEPLPMKRSGSLNATSSTATAPDLATFFGLAGLGPDVRSGPDARGDSGAQLASYTEEAASEGAESRPFSTPAASAETSSHAPGPIDCSTHRKSGPAPSSPSATAMGDATSSNLAEQNKEPAPVQRASRGQEGQSQEAVGERQENTLKRRKTAEHPLNQQSLGLSEAAADEDSAPPPSSPSKKSKLEGTRGSQDDARRPERDGPLDGVGSGEQLGHRDWMPRVDSETGSAAQTRGKKEGEGGEEMSDARAALVLESALSGSLMQPEGWDQGPEGWEREASLRIPEDPAELLKEAGKPLKAGSPTEVAARQAAPAAQKTQPMAAGSQGAGEK